METNQQFTDPELREAFGVILSLDCFSDYIAAIAGLIYNDSLSKESLSRILSDHNIERVEDIKEELLDLLLVYINLILNDHIIAEKERENLGLFKIYFKIKEGDFYKLRYDDIQDIISRQFERLYLDHKIDHEEAIHTGHLQGLFDLSYDQIDKFKEYYVILALESGADITDLDTVKVPDLGEMNCTLSRNPSQQVKDIVWNRDNGQCTGCGSTENLEFHHIIPLSKGGSNTVRNTRLLCQACIKQKSLTTDNNQT